jgi:acetyl-CoA C-acetyltransferase
MSAASIIGAYNTKFGSFAKKNRETGEITDTLSFYELIKEAGLGAVTDAGLEPSEIDAIWIGSCSPSLFVNQEHVGPLGVEVSPEDFRFLPTTRVEGACASSSVALYNALYGIESGRYKRVLVMGVEKMSLLNTKGVTHALACSSYWPEEGGRGMTFPGLFAEYAKGYKKQYGITDSEMAEMLAHVTALMYRNAYNNPLAHFGKGSVPEKLGLFSAEAVLGLPEAKNPMIADPLRLHDCSLITDGAAAVVLSADGAVAKSTDRRVRIAGIGHTTERFPISQRPNMYELMAAKEAARQAYSEAGITSADLDIAEVHDCFTINQLLCTEALGLAEDGKSGYEYKDGRFGADDRCAVNLSGGLKAKGHPVGATGVSMHALLYKQLTGDPIGLAPEGKSPETAAVLNVGGSAVTNCVTVLRRED